MIEDEHALIAANRLKAKIAADARDAEMASERRVISIPPSRILQRQHKPTHKKDHPVHTEQAHQKTPITGLVLSDAWVALLARAQVFAPLFQRGPRRALAWTRKPPTNGKKEVERRRRQMAAIFTVPA
jgi:hypothetical protein